MLMSNWSNSQQQKYKSYFGTNDFTWIILLADLYNEFKIIITSAQFLISDIPRSAFDVKRVSKVSPKRLFHNFRRSRFANRGPKCCYSHVWQTEECIAKIQSRRSIFEYSF
jgi:hypothetical protein